MNEVRGSLSIGQICPINKAEACNVKAEKEIIAFEEQGFFIEKVKDGVYLIFDDILGRYLLIYDEKLEEKLLKADEDFFNEVEEELGLKGEYEVFHNVDGINVFYPDFEAIDVTEGEEFRSFSLGKYKEKDGYILAVIPYENYIRYLYEKLGL